MNATFSISVEEITTPKNQKKRNVKRSIVPTNDERVEKIEQHAALFSELQHINLILTNKCNLSCSYCYEQHKEDYGRFTLQSLKKVYDFQLTCNDNEGKLFQFFGGEPLIHKDLILDFCRRYHDELQANENRIKVSMITNGTLLTPEFVDEYFSFSFVNMSISLDTINSNLDHRNIGQDSINRIIQLIERIPQKFKDNHAVSIRCTISSETVGNLSEFIQSLYRVGLRTMVIHPLTMSSTDGFIVWPEEKWNLLHDTITDSLQQLPDFSIQFSEGVGMKKHSNCMIGSDMIAVDGSGDFSGCYFFTNNKSQAADMILGNLFDGVVYIDRYKEFQSRYAKMFDEYEQCKHCDLKGFCYQCPAGNLSVDQTLFRPDAMCQQITKMFLDLQDDIVKKAAITKFKSLMSAVEQYGENITFTKAIVHLLYKMLTGHHISLSFDDVNQFNGTYQEILRDFYERLISKNLTLPCSVDEYLTNVSHSDGLDIKTFYEFLLEYKNLPSDASKQRGNVDDQAKRTFYLALIHLLILNSKGEKLQRSKLYMEQFS